MRRATGGLVAAVLAMACAVAAQAESRGDSIWNAGLGIGVPVSGLDLSRFGGGSEKPGGAGLAVSPQYLHHFWPALGLGLELGYMNLPAADATLPGGPAAASGSLYSAAAVGRYLFRPDSSFSPYLTAGVGIARYSVTVQQGGATILDTASTGLTVFPGAGLKADLGQRIQVSGEFRWQGGRVDRSDFGTNIYNVPAFFLRIGWRQSG